MLFSYKKRIFSYLFIVFACLLITACTVSEPSPEKLLDLPSSLLDGAKNVGYGGPPAQSEIEKITANIQCTGTNLDTCGIFVTVNALDKDLELDIWVHGEQGVQFLNYNDVIPTEGDLEASITDVKLLAGESRSVLFPYQPGNVILPGAYKVKVTATDTTENRIYDDTIMYVFIYRDESGEFSVLQSQDIFNGEYVNPFVDGSLHLGYAIDMEEGFHPDSGHIWVRVDSIKDGYVPTVTIESTGAVVFLEDVIWNYLVASNAQFVKPVISEDREKISRKLPPIDSGGSKIIRIPFELDSNGRLLDGNYVFMVTLHEDGAQDLHEKMPVVMELHSDPQNPENHWFVPATAPAVRVSATPRVTATPTPPPNAISMSDVPATVILGDGDGAGGEPNSNAGVVDDTAARCAVYSDASFLEEQLGKPHWTRNIGNYNGSLCDAYIDFIAEMVPISWLEFEQGMIARHATIIDEKSRLVTSQNYIIPEHD